MPQISNPSENTDTSSQFRTIIIGILAATGGLMSGLDIGVISGALDFVSDAFHASTFAQEWIVSAMMAGAAVGAVLAGWLAKITGRKWALVMGGVIFIIGSLGCALAWSVASMIWGRAMMGLAIGIAAFTSPLYLSEIASENTRGAMISTYQLMITVGIFMAFISDTLLSYHAQWRWMFGMIAIPGVLFVVGVLFLPYSPRWLMMQGRREEALAVLKDLRPTAHEAHAEIRAIDEQLKQRQGGFGLLWENANFRRSILLGVMLQAMQQFAGINVVMYYAPKIFAMAGFVGTAQMWCTAMIGFVNVLATLAAIGLVDRWGRKPILYCGFSIMTVSMAALAVLNHVGMESDGAKILCVFLIMIFIVAHAMSAGPLMWVLCSEIQPIKGRDLGITLSTLTNWISNMIVGASFLSLLGWLGGAKTFGLIALLNGLFLVLTKMFVPETKGISLEVIEQNLMAGKKLREIGR
ncbi:sugar porter family MFS transporter [Acetobacter tropicalis]|uniref:D-galactose transporter GalP n=2 Tax=Acetobacter TaxID=434 RepID=A0A252EK76_9PROT|nr:MULTISPECIES: sugar porter family MFS transporter [Acetobacter]MCC6105628.1 sugar porter family MFS transporter [Acetobacter sp.]MCG4253922.1 sugar porter family MFS transporter [Acetobacter senegalensis]MCG4260112.1 sugar porter family MFS transporter [Acetobacter senegalensis]MCG4272381.1 sugar porter family MFS transporter [Acetobacter senegalensis]MCP1194450.1 sugar porter family MFS transporter [Acetobacter senegalensis]